VKNIIAALLLIAWLAALINQWLPEWGCTCILLAGIGVMVWGFFSERNTL
jgi:hypothetical protein